MFFIPILIATFQGMLNNVTLFATYQATDTISIPINYTLILISTLGLWYMYLDFFSGVVSSLYFIAAQGVMLHLQATWSLDISFLQFCVYLNIAAWIAQFVGHFVFEGEGRVEGRPGACADGQYLLDDGGA